MPDDATRSSSGTTPSYPQDVDHQLLSSSWPFEGSSEGSRSKSDIRLSWDDTVASSWDELGQRGDAPWESWRGTSSPSFSVGDSGGGDSLLPIVRLPAVPVRSYSNESMGSTGRIALGAGPFDSIEMHERRSSVLEEGRTTTRATLVHLPAASVLPSRSLKRSVVSPPPPAPLPRLPEFVSIFVSPINVTQPRRHSDSPPLSQLSPSPMDPSLSPSRRIPTSPIFSSEPEDERTESLALFQDQQHHVQSIRQSFLGEWLESTEPLAARLGEGDMTDDEELYRLAREPAGLQGGFRTGSPSVEERDREILARREVHSRERRRRRDGNRRESTTRDTGAGSRSAPVTTRRRWIALTLGSLAGLLAAITVGVILGRRASAPARSVGALSRSFPFLKQVC